MNPNGVFGSILKITNPDIVIKGPDEMEKIITTGKDTSIKNKMDTIKLSDLKVNDKIVVIGSPNDAGKIDAKLIRVLPELPLPLPPFQNRPEGQNQPETQTQPPIQNQTSTQTQPLPQTQQ
jgi:hypothetical protein